jgi:hypothetical protein
MTGVRQSQLRGLEGRRVSVSLANGSRIDDCQLVSWGCTRTRNLWLFANGEDTFVSFDDVVDVWEARPAGRAVA